MRPLSGWTRTEGRRKSAPQYQTEADKLLGIPKKSLPAKQQLEQPDNQGQSFKVQNLKSKTSNLKSESKGEP
jgi:hypothetical protein